MTRYNIGAKFEREVKEHFEKAGYYVIRSAGSFGIVDLVAVPTMFIRPSLVIQCKRYIDRKPAPSDDFIKLEINATKLWCTKQRGQRGFDTEEVG